jgi:hypothetical protein
VDYRGLAGSGHKLRNLVLSQAKKLTLSLEAVSAISELDSLRAPFLAAVRRPHGRLSLSLRLHQVSGRQIRGLLKELGTCHAVEELELMGSLVSHHWFTGFQPTVFLQVCINTDVMVPTQDRDQWTRQASSLAVKLFPNLTTFKMCFCAIPLADALPLLQRQPPLAAVELTRSQLCSAAGKYDHRWLLQMVTANRSTQLEIYGALHPSWRYLAFPPQRSPGQPWSTTLTHLAVYLPRMGYPNAWFRLLAGCLPCRASQHTLTMR